MIPDPLIRIKIRAVRWQWEHAKLPLGAADKALYGLGPVHRMTVNDEEHRHIAVDQKKRVRKSMNFAVVNVPGQPANRRSPRELMAEIKFKEKRAPVRSTVGACPIGAQVVPL